MLGKEVTYADPGIQQCIEQLRDRLAAQLHASRNAVRLTEVGWFYRKVRELLQKMIDGCGRAIHKAEQSAQDVPDAEPTDVEWFRVMRAKSRACLSALNTGDQDEFRALVGHIRAAKDSPL